ncbi:MULTISPECIES: PD-(D/E)XK nuclease family protein [Olivibacter]|uniref:PD-(D/E)XK nuclease family protein n=1 Tax=Olivibacter jilunii TaxID=985016 RepID=A0ABW6B707_9SPHI
MNKQQSLERFLKEAQFPKPVRRKRTFFDISGTSHYELAISNWYAYFFDQEEDHGLGNLFIECLFELVKRKTGKEISLRFFKVEKEVTTKGGKRIDILVSGIEQDERKYIIIENKINHWLNNDLDAYWQHCVGAEDSKVGVVLSLNRETIPLTVQHKFVNVQHGEIINLVKEKLSTYKQEASYYLNEFITTIENLYTDLTMNEEVKFYYQNLENCNRIYDIVDLAYKYVIDQLAAASEILGLQASGKSDYHRYIYDPRHEGISYTIHFDKLFEQKKEITINIELYGNALLIEDMIDERVGSDAVVSGGLAYKTNRANGWLYYASKTYEVKEDDLEELANFVAEKMRDDFEVIYDKIEEGISNR